MELFGTDQLMEEAEVSEWLDWMRTELPAAGVQLPPEEASVWIAVNALRFAERVCPLFRHLGALRPQVVQAAILRQCFERQTRSRERSLNNKLTLPGSWEGLLPAAHVVRYISGFDADQRCWLEGSDGFTYASLCLPKPTSLTARATHIICAEIAYLMGMRVGISVPLTMSQKLHNGFVGMPTGGPRCPGPCSRGPCLGIRHSRRGTNGSDVCVAGYTRRNRGLRAQIALLVFNILVANAAPEAEQTYYVSPTSGALDRVLIDLSHCLMDSDWDGFLRSSDTWTPPPQWATERVRTLRQLTDWLQRIDRISYHGLWELAFQMPPEWYGHDRKKLVRVIEKLEHRRWEAHKIILRLIRAGYFPNFSDPKFVIADEPGVKVVEGLRHESA